MFRLNDYLVKAGIHPNDTTVLLHKPDSVAFARALPALVLDEPALFETYQSYHSVQATATLRRREFMVSFVALPQGNFVLAGLYRRVHCADRLVTEIETLPPIVELQARYQAFSVKQAVTWAWFTFERLPQMQSLVGRLCIPAPLGRAYARLAENLDADVAMISDDVLLRTRPPDWTQINLSAAELRGLPGSWKARLTAWRGIYLVTDQSDGGRYVGAAYGVNNLLGRWMKHIAGDHGITAGLEDRLTDNFRFTILQLVAPTAVGDDVIKHEANWKERLHTRQFGLNRN